MFKMFTGKCMRIIITKLSATPSKIRWHESPFCTRSSTTNAADLLSEPCFPQSQSAMMFALLKHHKAFTNSSAWLLGQITHHIAASKRYKQCSDVPESRQESPLSHAQTSAPSSFFSPGWKTASGRRRRSPAIPPLCALAVWDPPPRTANIHLQREKMKSRHSFDSSEWVTTHSEAEHVNVKTIISDIGLRMPI